MTATFITQIKSLLCTSITKLDLENGAIVFHIRDIVKVLNAIKDRRTEYENHIASCRYMIPSPHNSISIPYNGHNIDEFEQYQLTQLKKLEHTPLPYDREIIYRNISNALNALDAHEAMHYNKLIKIKHNFTIPMRAMIHITELLGYIGSVVITCGLIALYVYAFMSYSDSISNNFNDFFIVVIGLTVLIAPVVYIIGMVSAMKSEFNENDHRISYYTTSGAYKSINTYGSASTMTSASGVIFFLIVNVICFLSFTVIGIILKGVYMIITG